MKKPKYILTDIEGTTTPKTFVYDVLFPYFEQKIKALSTLMENEKFKDTFEEIKAVIQLEQGVVADAELIQATLESWVKTDRKETSMKQLQGLIWENGYQEGVLKGELYNEVRTCFEKWKEEEIQIAIYSSGSVQAQKLLFGFSEKGDLTPFISAYFDTKIGHKREKKSYENIAEQLSVPASEILFLSDISEELDAAKASGMEAIQVVRDETTIPSPEHNRINNFNQIAWK